MRDTEGLDYLLTSRLCVIIHISVIASGTAVQRITGACGCRRDHNGSVIVFIWINRDLFCIGTAAAAYI